MGDGDLDAACEGILDLLVAAESHPDAHRRDDLQVGVERLDRDIEAHLVVALAGAAMGHGIRLLAVRDLHQELRDQGTGKRRGERIRILVHGVRLEARHAEILDEALARIDDVRPIRPCGQRPGRHAVAQRPAADIDGQRHDLRVESLAQPRHSDRCIESA
jgi:hypothetical protein